MPSPDRYILIPKSDVPISRLEEQVYYESNQVLEESDFHDQEDLTPNVAADLNINLTSCQKAIEIHQYRGIPHLQVIETVIDKYDSVSAIIKVCKNLDEPTLTVKVYDISSEGEWELDQTDEIDQYPPEERLRYRGVELTHTGI